MKNLFIALALILAPSACSSSTPKARTIDLAALAEAHDAAWNRHDPEAMAALFAEDGTLVTPRGTRAEGQQELLTLLSQPGPTRETTSTTRFGDVQWLADDLVLLDGVQTLDGPGVEQMGGASEAHVVAIARHVGDDWRLVAARPYMAR